MTGIEFLTEAIDLQPDARRVLLTAYADTDVAIRAINEIRLDQYLLKPWDPPEERLYPVLDDLADWAAGYRPPFVGLRLIAGRWAPKATRSATTSPATRSRTTGSTRHRPRGPAGGAGAPGWRNPRSTPPSRSSSSKTASSATRPSARSRSGRDPDHGRAAVLRPGHRRWGTVRPGAAVYGASEGLKTVLVEREAPGGQAGTTSRIENYLGFPAGLSGGDLARRALAQARRLGRRSCHRAR